MLAEQESLIYQHFVELVTECNLEPVIKNISSKYPKVNKAMANINKEDDYRHNNRLILFNLLKSDSTTIFYDFIQSLRECKHSDLANKLENQEAGSALNLPPHVNQALETGKVSRINTHGIGNLLMVLLMKIFPAKW